MNAPLPTKRYIISFLGIKPKKTTYRCAVEWKNVSGSAVQTQTIETPYVSYAVHGLSEATRSFVICTEEAAETFDAMQKNDTHRHIFVKGLMNVHMSSADSSADFVMVGKEDGNIDDIFGLIDKIVSNNNAPDVEWLFDITGTFRSIPFTVNVVLEYLSVLTNLRVYDICYARFGDTTQILSIYLQRTYTLWVRATDAFVRYGQADQLVALFEQLPPERGGAIDYIEVIQRMVDTLYTAQFIQLRESAKKLLTMVDNERNQPLFLGAYEPLTKLLQHIRNAYAVFVDDDDINLQRHVICWYINHRMWAQAIIASHEYMISLAMHYDNDKNKTRKHWDNVGMGSFTDDKNNMLYVIWEKTQDNIINRVKLHLRCKNNGDGYNQKIVICQMMERYFTDTNQAHVQDVTVLLQKMRNEKKSEWVNKMTDLHLKKLKEYANADVGFLSKGLTVAANGQQIESCFNLLIQEVFRNRDKSLRGIPKDITLYPIGNEIRKARNSVSHMQGVADIATIKSLCERLITVSESMQRQQRIIEP